jgi:ATP/ADP translocase
MELTKQGLLQRVFNIYPGEEKNAFLFACLGFLWALGITSGLKFADALFLLHVGAESLPQLYTWISCGMLIVASLLLYAFHHFSSDLIFRTALALGILFYLFVFVCLQFNIEDRYEWFWFSLRIAGSFLFSISMTCYWTFIDQYHHIQDAKRLYSLFSSSIFLGAATTGLLMRAGFLDLYLLIGFIIFLLSLTFYWIGKITRDVPLVFHEDTEPEGEATELGNPLRFLLKSIWNSPFTLLLMSSNFLIQLLLVITEYNYMSTFQEYFANQPINESDEGTEAQLTLFLGQWLAIVSICNLVFGLFAYSRLVRRFGLSGLLMITPTLLMVSFTGWSLTEMLVYPLIGFFVVEGTLYVIDDSNFNLLLNAVPSKLKYKIRVMIESFFEPIGMLMSASLLAVFQQQSRWLGWILSLCALMIAFALRSQYLKALFSNLAETAIHFQRTIENWLSKMTDKQQKIAEQRLLSILRTGDDQAQLFACEGLLAFEDSAILRQLLEHTSRMKAESKIQLIILLEKSVFAKDNLVLDTIQDWIRQDFDSRLKSTVHFYLAKQGLLHPEKVSSDLKSSDIALQGAAILALKKSMAHLSPATAAYNRTLAAQHLKLLLDSQHEEEICMGLQILGMDGDTHDVDILISYLRHSSIKIARTAAKAIAQANSLDSIRQAPQLLSQLSLSQDNEIRLDCLKALGKVNDSSLVYDMILASVHFRPNERRLTETVIYKMGLRTVPTLLALTKNIHLPDRCRLLAGRILGRLSLPQLRSALSDLIRQEIERAYFYFYHAQTIQLQRVDLDLSMLKDVLLTGYHSVLDFIIQLLGLAGEVEDIELLSRSLRSHNPKIRSQVVETLEKTCEPSIFRLLQPLVEDIPHHEKIRAYLKAGHPPLSLTALLDKMSDSPAQIDQIMAATMKYHLNLPNWRETLRQQMSKRDEIFHHFAYELLES